MHLSGRNTEQIRQPSGPGQPTGMNRHHNAYLAAPSWEGDSKADRPQGRGLPKLPQSCSFRLGRHLSMHAVVLLVTKGRSG